MEQTEGSTRGRIVFAALLVAMLAGIAIVVANPFSSDDSSGEGGAGPEDLAFIEPHSGTTGDAEPDGRARVEPPEAEDAALEEAVAAAGCQLQGDLPEEGSEHLPPDAPAPDYETVPPSSGNHLSHPQADGAYLTPPEQVNVVHSLEHGRVALQYGESVPEPEQLEIKGVFEADPAGMLLLPNPEMPYAVAATAWTQVLGCDSYEGESTLIALQAFIEEHRGNGPEEALPLSL